MKENQYCSGGNSWMLWQTSVYKFAHTNTKIPFKMMVDTGTEGCQGFLWLRRSLIITQDRHFSLFSSREQPLVHAHKVPQMNQHMCPVWNSQAGHCSFTPHLTISQHSSPSCKAPLWLLRRNHTSRSIYAGIFREPCSYLCTDRRPRPRTAAISFWVLPSFILALWKASFSKWTSCRWEFSM